MMGDERRFEILNKLNRNNFISVSKLAESFLTHETTIRRDLEILEKEGKIIRVHGGASPINLKNSEPIFESRQTERIEEKQKIGLVAAAMICDGDNIILDSGTTTLQIALELKKRTDLSRITVVTNDIKIASVLNSCQFITVLVVGGILYPNSFMLNGQLTTSALNGLNVDKSFIATTALDIEVGLTHFDETLTMTKRAMIDISTTKIVVADTSKIGQKALYTFLDIRDIDVLITDSSLTQEMKELLIEKGIGRIENV